MTYRIGDTVEHRHGEKPYDLGTVVGLTPGVVEVRWANYPDITCEDDDDEKLAVVAHAKSSEHRGWEDFGREVIKLATELGARIGYQPTTTGQLLTDAHAALGGLSGLARAAVAMNEEVVP